VGAELKGVVNSLHSYPFHPWARSWEKWPPAYSVGAEIIQKQKKLTLLFLAKHLAVRKANLA
jgi:hypothetical protein